MALDWAFINWNFQNVWKTDFLLLYYASSKIVGAKSICTNGGGTVGKDINLAPDLQNMKIALNKQLSRAQCGILFFFFQSDFISNDFRKILILDLYDYINNKFLDLSKKKSVISKLCSHCHQRIEKWKMIICCLPKFELECLRYQYCQLLFYFMKQLLRPENCHLNTLFQINF